jgi:hypothetical protein
VLYFAYGSNMSSPRLVERVGEVGIVGVARLGHHQHRFSKLGADGTAKGNIEPVAGARALGVVYELSDAQFDRLAGFEGGYRRTSIEFTGAFARGPAPALTFVALRVIEGIAPSEAYLAHYQAGIGEHGIDPAYLAELSTL